MTMPIQRRARLLPYARARGAFVVEDDYDSEFRYESPPISSIQGLDPRRVVYIGTFSKTLCPALRIGYIVFPPELVNRGREVKWFTDLHNSSVEQIVLARFIAGGHYLRHLHAMKKAHRALREVLVGALGKNFTIPWRCSETPRGSTCAPASPAFDSAHSSWRKSRRQA